MASGPKRDCLTHHVTMVVSCFFVCGKDTHRTTVIAQMQQCQKYNCSCIQQLQSSSSHILKPCQAFCYFQVQTHIGIASSPGPSPPLTWRGSGNGGRIAPLNKIMNALSLPPLPSPSHTIYLPCMLYLQIHPIFVLSIADCLLGSLWVIGGIFWFSSYRSALATFSGPAQLSAVGDSLVHRPLPPTNMERVWEQGQNSSTE